VAFRATLNTLFRHVYGATDVVSAFQKIPWALRLLLPCIGGTLAGAVAFAGSRTKGGGVGEVMEAVVLGRVGMSLRSTVVKTLGSWLAIAGGGSIGREGPLIQFGGSMGATTARVFDLDERRARTLIAAGTAAGFAAAYNTPFAAVLFVLEVVTGIVALDAVVPTILASAIATALTRAIVGAGPIYGSRAFTLASDWELLAYAGLGALAALAAQGFMRLLSAGERAFALSRLPVPLRAGFGGLLVGCIAVWFPQVTGNGYEPLNAMLDGSFPIGVMGALLLLKSLATTASVSSGSPGGVFTPTLFLGAALGACCQHALRVFAGSESLGEPGAYALVGMAAMTAATTHAPLMAAVLVFELSGVYAIVLALLLATAIAVGLSRLLRHDSIYTAELRRRGFAWELTLEGRLVAREGSTSLEAPREPETRS
jgi:CIC family chloride channel protein